MPPINNFALEYTHARKEMRRRGKGSRVKDKKVKHVGGNVRTKWTGKVKGCPVSHGSRELVVWPLVLTPWFLQRYWQPHAISPRYHYAHHIYDGALSILAIPQIRFRTLIDISAALLGGETVLLSHFTNSVLLSVTLVLSLHACLFEPCPTRQSPC